MIILAIIRPSVWPSLFSIAMHLIIQPLALIYAAIGPFVCAFSIYFIVFEVSRINWPIRGAKNSKPLLDSFEILAFIPIAIKPLFAAMSMLLIFAPLTYILSTIAMRVYPISTSLASLPAALINISSCMRQSSRSVGHVIFPHSFVAWSIRPLDLPQSLPCSLLQLSSIIGAIDRLSLNPFIQGISGWAQSYIAYCEYFLIAANLFAPQIPLYWRFYTYAIIYSFEFGLVQAWQFCCILEFNFLITWDFFSTAIITVRCLELISHRLL